MKKIIIYSLITLSALAANAQATYLSQNFDTVCASSGGFPSDWTSYNPISATVPNGAWACTADGRYGTPGMLCTGVYGSPAAYNLDTAYLITPPLNLTSYTGNVYLNFDTKTSNVNLDARLSLLLTHVDSTDTLRNDTTTAAEDPVFGNSDSSGWVTHQADITSYCTSSPLYIAFRYTSSTTSGSTWYLDNVHTTTFPLQVTNPKKNPISLTVIGISTSSQATISYKTNMSGIYHLAIYDMLGREVYTKNDLAAQPGTNTYTIDGLDMHSGIYLVKMSNGLTYATAKTIVR